MILLCRRKTKVSLEHRMCTNFHRKRVWRPTCTFNDQYSNAVYCIDVQERCRHAPNTDDYNNENINSTNRTSSRASCIACAVPMLNTMHTLTYTLSLWVWRFFSRTRYTFTVANDFALFFSETDCIYDKSQQCVMWNMIIFLGLQTFFIVFMIVNLSEMN